MTPVGFEPTISADQRLQTYVLDRAAIGTGRSINKGIKINNSRKLDISMSSRKDNERQNTFCSALGTKLIFGSFVPKAPYRAG
jgi:hypothetical protein